MKIYTFRGKKVYLEKAAYQYNNRIAVEMYTEDDEPYCTVTTNLPNEDVMNENAGFVNEFGDSFNRFEMIHWLEENGIAFQTYNQGFSGYNTYWEMVFNTDMF